MKFLVHEKDEQYEENEDKKSKDTIEKRFRESEQLDLFPQEKISMYQRVVSFLKDLRLSDFD